LGAVKQRERAQAEALERQVNKRLARERQQIELKAKAAEAATQERIQSLLADKEALQAEKNEALNRAENSKANWEVTVSQRAQQIRVEEEKKKIDEVNALKAEHFQEMLKVNEKVQALRRSLEQKNAQELDEGAEVDLFEALKAAFPNDRFTRVPKDVAGADIHHVVMYNGKACGITVYDSKNRNGYATKLRADQIAAKAEHAILSTWKFPAGTQQVTEREGVIVANPVRVITLAGLLRRHLIQTSSLRIVGKDPDGKKKTALHALITSEPFWQKLRSIENIADKMPGFDANERKAHEKMWKPRPLINLLLKSCADICADIESIIGTAESE
jgi:hypothetical protein